MRAIILKEDGYSGQATGPHILDAALYLEEATLPMPVAGKGQVVIKLRVASVNPSDLHFIKGEYGQPRVKGKPAGFEGCGDVVEAGAGAETLLGQRVAFVVSQNGSGAWADYALTDAINCIQLMPEITDEDGAAQIVNPLTAMAMVDMAAQAGEAVVISAATSQLGKLMIGLARDKGLKTIALVRRATAIAPLKALGATEVLDITAAGFSTDIAQVYRHHKPCVFLDAVADQISEQIFVAMPNGARWVCYGKLGDQPPTLTQIGQLIFMGKQIEGFWLTRWMQSTPPEVQRRVVGEVQSRFKDGRWKTDVSARLTLADTGAGNIVDGKVMIRPK